MSAGERQETLPIDDVEKLADLEIDRRELTRLNDLLHGYRRREDEKYKELYATAHRVAWEAITSATRPPYVTDEVELTAAAEIRWLRSYIRQAGRRLHDEYGLPSPPINDRCRCVGCDLIVGTDLGDRPEGGDLPERDDTAKRLMHAENEAERLRGLLHINGRAERQAEENTDG